jgi:probable F420-dependent oxidoreductase
MHLGLKIGPATDSAVGERAAQAEELGFDSVWLSERVAVPLDKPHPYQPMADPWIGLAFVAALTKRVQLGTSVSQIAVRHPVLMARELATLDRLSNGRVIVGAGAGWVEEEFTATGIPFDTRGGRLNETVKALRHLWSEPETPWKGRHFDLLPMRIVTPLTPGGPPIFIGASGPAGLRRVARLADGFLAGFLTPEALAGIRRMVLDMLAAERPGVELPMYCQVKPPRTVAEARETVEQFANVGMDGIIVADPLDAGDSVPPPDAVAALVELTRLR